MPRGIRFSDGRLRKFIAIPWFVSVTHQNRNVDANFWNCTAYNTNISKALRNNITVLITRLNHQHTNLCSNLWIVCLFVMYAIKLISNNLLGLRYKVICHEKIITSSIIFVACAVKKNTSIGVSTWDEEMAFRRKTQRRNACTFRINHRNSCVPRCVLRRHQSSSPFWSWRRPYGILIAGIWPLNRLRN